MIQFINLIIIIFEIVGIVGEIPRHVLNIYSSFSDHTYKTFFGEITIRRHIMQHQILRRFYFNSIPVIINDNKIGPVAQEMYDTIYGIQTGKIEDFMDWTVPVE